MSKEMRKWMPMFWKDYLADTSHLSATEHGAYLLLIAHYWISGGLPTDDDVIRRIAKIRSKDWPRVRSMVYMFFGKPSLGSPWVHKRVDLELSYAIEKSRINSTNVSKRYNGRSTPVHTPTPTPIKKEEIGRKPQNLTGRKEGYREGHKAFPESPEFKAWKAWSFEHKPALWRELVQREQEGRSFDFETILPQ